MKKIILLLAIFLSLGTYAQQEITPLVQVVGEGIVTVVPDKVLIKTRVEHNGPSASEVKSQNDKVVNEVLKYLKSEGIPAKNIQTDYIRLNKEYDYGKKEYYYSANQAISIHLDDLDRYEEIMSGLVDSGLNRIEGIQFQTSKEEELEAEARRKAVLHAKQKAEEYADALGQNIGRAVTISEEQNQNGQPVYRVMRMESADSSQKETIAPGEMEVSVKVNVGFQLR